MNPSLKKRSRFWSLSYQASMASLLCCALGCQGMFSRNDAVAADPYSPDQSASIDNVQGPMQRSLLASHSNSITNSSGGASNEGIAEYQTAKRLYDAGDYKGAEKAFHKIAEAYKLDESGTHRKRRLGNMLTPLSKLKASYTDAPLREDAMFMLAESRFAMEEYPGAEDIYLGLLKDYPNTRHLDTATRRLYDIALTWMDFKVARSEEVQVASFSDTGRASRPEVVQNKEYNRPGFFNFTDKKRPTTDTEGRALEALKAIWLNDPTGPLADDALMMTASHYLRVGRFEEAAETYRLLREEFPNSPHAKDAYVLGAHTVQASYQGAEYDGKALTEATQLKRVALQAFPNMSAEEKARLQEELVRIDDATVARDFSQAILWLRKGRFEAVRISCWHIINTYPSSKYADKARGLLTMIPELENKNTLLLAISGFDERDIPAVSASEFGQTTPTEQLTQRPVAPTPAPTPAPEVEPEEEAEPDGKPRYFPSWGMPKLKPIPIPGFGREKKPEEVTPSPETNDTEPGRVNLTSGN